MEAASTLFNSFTADYFEEEIDNDYEVYDLPLFSHNDYISTNLGYQ
jgi:hypothetical protein